MRSALVLNTILNLKPTEAECFLKNPNAENQINLNLEEIWTKDFLKHPIYILIIQYCPNWVCTTETCIQECQQCLI